MNIIRIPSAIALSLLVSTATIWSANAGPPPESSSARVRAKISQTKADLISLSSAIAMYKLNAGLYPTAEQGLKSLVNKPDQAPVPRRWAQLMAEIPKDPWGHDYRYVVREKDGKTIHVLISDGADLLDPADNIEKSLEAEQK